MVCVLSGSARGWNARHRNHCGDPSAGLPRARLSTEISKTSLATRWTAVNQRRRAFMRNAGREWLWHSSHLNRGFCRCSRPCVGLLEQSTSAQVNQREPLAGSALPHYWFGL